MVVKNGSFSVVSVIAIIVMMHMLGLGFIIMRGFDLLIGIPEIRPGHSG